MESQKTQEVLSLKELREQRQLSQAKLGQLIGVSERNIWDWEKGRRLPRLDNAVALAKALNVSFKSLVQSFGLTVDNIPDDRSKDD